MFIQCGERVLLRVYSICILFGLLGIAPTRNCAHFLKLDSWSLGAGFIPIISTKGINEIKKGNCNKKNFRHTKRFIKFFKIWLQFRVGAIPRLPYSLYDRYKIKIIVKMNKNYDMCLMG